MIQRLLVLNAVLAGIAIALLITIYQDVHRKSSVGETPAQHGADKAVGTYYIPILDKNPDCNQVSDGFMWRTRDGRVNICIGQRILEIVK